MSADMLKILLKRSKITYHLLAPSAGLSTCQKVMGFIWVLSTMSLVGSQNVWDFTNYGLSQRWVKTA
jgi:hypothetical protein